MSYHEPCGNWGQVSGRQFLNRITRFVGQALIVTPRYHHIHHSDDPRYSGKNMGAVSTIWDRVFGTYLDPDTVQSELRFGIGEKENPIRVMLGV